MGTVVPTGDPAADGVPERAAGLSLVDGPSRVGHGDIDDGRIPPLRTAISKRDEESERIFEWATEDPPLHARYRLEWRFKARSPGEQRERQASERMRDLGIVQEGAPILRLAATPFDLPAKPT